MRPLAGKIPRSAGSKKVTSPRDRALGALVALLGAAFGLRKIDDFDTWWHLAAGRWIAAHGIPRTDTLSETVRDHAWINLQWGFDVSIYCLHWAFGPAVLCLACAAAFAAAIWLTW